MKIDNFYYQNQLKNSLETKATNTQNTNSVFKGQVQNEIAKELSSNQSSQTRNKRDKIELSNCNHVDNSKELIANLKQNIIEDIKKPTDAEKIAQLKEQIDSNKYKIDPDEIAKIIIRLN